MSADITLCSSTFVYAQLSSSSRSAELLARFASYAGSQLRTGLVTFASNKRIESSYSGTRRRVHGQKESRGTRGCSRFQKNVMGYMDDALPPKRTVRGRMAYESTKIAFSSLNGILHKSKVVCRPTEGLDQRQADKLRYHIFQRLAGQFIVWATGLSHPGLFPGCARDTEKHDDTVNPI